MFSVFLLCVEDLIKQRTVEYYKCVCWIEGVWRSKECNFEIHPQDYLGHFSVKTFLLTILIQRVNLVRILGMSRIIEQKSSSSRWRLSTKTSYGCEIHERLGGSSALFIGVAFSGFHSNRQKINIKLSHQHFLSPLGPRVLSGRGEGAIVPSRSWGRLEIHCQKFIDVHFPYISIFTNKKINTNK